MTHSSGYPRIPEWVLKSHWMDGWTGRWMDGQMGRWVERRMDEGTGGLSKSACLSRLPFQASMSHPHQAAHLLLLKYTILSSLTASLNAISAFLKFPESTSSCCLFWTHIQGSSSNKNPLFPSYQTVAHCSKLTPHSLALGSELLGQSTTDHAC